MSSVAPFSQAIQTLDDDAWDDLLNFIEERRVIPIIGPELLKVETEGGRRLLYDWLAEKLAAKLGVDTALLPQPYTLNDVVCWFLASHGRREEAYTRLRSILRDANFAPPLALRQLAQITDFDLFVTTTFDPLLEQAINAERFQGAQSTEVIAYSPNRVADLPTEREKLQRPVVYHLLGRLSASPTYVISDEDTLEFICALQSEHLTPEKLFHELEHNHLLLIGSSFTNWLARLFLRMAKRHRLSDPRDVGEVLADNHSDSDGRLMAFLQQVSVRTRVYSGAEKFVDELHRRWTARRKPGDVIALGAAPQRFLPPEREMPDNAVFISYAREDLAAVQKLKAGLDAAGRHDLVRPRAPRRRRRLRPQDPAQHRPLLVLHPDRLGDDASAGSKATSAASGAMRSIARATWPRARCSSCRCASTTPNGGDAQVPDKFKAVHFTRLPGGEVTPEFARRLQDLLSATASRSKPCTSPILAWPPIPTAPPRSPSVDAAASLARPRLVHRGDARIFLRPRRGGRRARAPRAAQAPHDPLRPVGSRQDLDPARRASCRACGPRATARSTCASTIRPSRPRPPSRSSRRSSARRRRRASGRRPASRSRASRCGSSCTTATTCCATRPARR